jgi:hypothetical protein
MMTLIFPNIELQEIQISIYILEYALKKIKQAKPQLQNYTVMMLIDS